jgi:hypothetical protein
MRKMLVILGLLALIATACGGEAADPAPAEDTGATATTTNDTEAPPTETKEEGNSAQNQPTASPASGSVVVDGETFDVMETYRCEPYDGPGADPQPDDLDLVAFAADSNYLSLTLGHDEAVNMSNGERYPREIFDLRLDVVTDEGQVEYELVASNDSDGNWLVSDLEETSLDGAPFNIEGDHISGGMTLVETYPNEGDSTVNVSFELEIPGDIQDCSA